MSGLCHQGYQTSCLMTLTEPVWFVYSTTMEDAVCPFVYWSQTKAKVHLKIDLREVKVSKHDPSVNINIHINSGHLTLSK